MLILGIETTCDEAGCAIVKNGRDILSNVVTSQIDLHKEYGGVVPELACRRHVDILIPVIDQALLQANLTCNDIDLIAVAQGPGLIGALLIGINAAKTLAWSLQKPLLGINHIEAHLYAALMSHPTPITFPCIGAVLSGGHTSLVLMHDVGNYTLIGQTVDDAIGEAFDKAAKVLDLPYPGGPQIEKLALKGNPNSYPFRAGKVKGKPFDFSFSGLKTGVLYSVKGPNLERKQISPEEKANIAASFQEAAFRDVIKKTLEASNLHGCSQVVFGGGVTCNQHLRNMFASEAPSLTCFWPHKNLSLDNAAMIAGLAYHQYQRKLTTDSLEIEASTNMPF
jgi:N6-L-threonylcarbamoyladenine synthase